MNSLTLTQLLQDHLDPFLSTHQVPPYQLKALKAYRSCRTKKLGSHGQYCPNGHLLGVWYNSCHRRGCPQCLALPSARWLRAQQEKLLNVTHHHWVFTLPHELLPLWRYNRARLQDHFYQVVSQIIKTLSHDKQFLGAQPGYMLTLHTWGRNLSLHPHIHCLITHGGLDHDGNWKVPRKKILFPARIMMHLLRGKLLASLRNDTQINLPPDLSQIEYRRMLNRLRQKEWVVHCQPPYLHGRGVVTYLSRYVKRGPFKNHQLKAVQNGKVSFSYQSHQLKRKARDHISLDAFVLRICDHIPQTGKTSLRYYGLYHSRQIDRLNLARARLNQPPVCPAKFLSIDDYLEQQGLMDPCPLCTEMNGQSPS